MSQVETRIVPVGENGDVVVQRSDKLHLQSRDEGPNAILFDRPRYEQAYMAAQMFAKSDLVPAHFRGKPENCFIACQLAMRFEMDPFMVMQNCYVVHGRPGFEGKFIIALINASRQFQDPLDYEFLGVQGSDEWRVVVSAKRVGTGKLCSMTFRYATAKAEGWVSGNKKWTTMPEQMMMYRGAAFFARVYCPEVIMGMPTSEELEDISLVESTGPIVVQSTSRTEQLAAKLNAQRDAAKLNTPNAVTPVGGRLAQPETTAQPVAHDPEAGSGSTRPTSDAEADEFASLLPDQGPTNKPSQIRKK